MYPVYSRSETNCAQTLITFRHALPTTHHDQEAPNLHVLTPSRLPTTAVSSASNYRRQTVHLSPNAHPRAGTAAAYFQVPRTNSATEAHPRQLLDGTAHMGDSLRRFPEYISGRARRYIEELLDRAVFHEHLRLGQREG